MTFLEGGNAGFQLPNVTKQYSYGCRKSADGELLYYSCGGTLQFMYRAKFESETFIAAKGKNVTPH